MEFNRFFKINKFKIIFLIAFSALLFLLLELGTMCNIPIFGNDAIYKCSRFGTIPKSLYYGTFSYLMFIGLIAYGIKSVLHIMENDLIYMGVCLVIHILISYLLSVIIELIWKELIPYIKNKIRK